MRDWDVSDVGRGTTLTRFVSSQSNRSEWFVVLSRAGWSLDVRGLDLVDVGVWGKLLPISGFLFP